MKFLRTSNALVGLVLILLFMWVGSYLALRTWRATEPIIGVRQFRSILVSKKLLPLTVVYRPLVKLDQQMTETHINFVDEPVLSMGW